MQTPERPFDGEASGDGAPSYEWLDEWLCEYVDGTMDPSVEAVFEQYVEANPDLKAHVERLRQTREILCGCDAPEAPSTEMQAEVCSEVEEDLLQSPTVLPDATSERSKMVLGIASSIAVALVVGFLAGSMLVAPTSSPPPTAAPAERQAVPPTSVQDDAGSRLGRSAPPAPSQTSSFSVGESPVLRSTTPPPAGPDTVVSRLSPATMGK
jgi:anti-sigma factor RsiW